MNTTAAAPAPPLFPMAVPSAAPAWHLPHFSPSTTAHVKQEPSDGEAADRHDDSGISPGRSASASGSSGGPSPEREDPGPSQHHHYFQHQQQMLSSPPPNPNGHYLERLDNTPTQTQHNAYYYNHHQQQQNGRGQPLPQEPYYQQQQQQQQQQQEQSDSSAQFQLGSPAREPLPRAVPQSPQLRTPPPAGSAQAKQEPASPPEGSSSPGQPPQASSAVSQADENSSSSSHSSTEGEGALRRLQAAVETMGMVNGNADGGTTYECPVCTVRTQDKEQFQAHLGTHYEPRCPSCDHVASTVENLRAHMREAHALSPPQDDPAETKINSQGRVKTFRCKQCGFVAVTKLEFWKHSRLHIKAEKLLTCNRCPFVTEYKHHLEYHLRNHSGWKPFHCDKCDYQCVNKSMLNSHLKSHSNIYQYRCADCTYATKYCHSLKLHLRKYHHTPDVVLNPDGSPNPLPIIDVYGTRRGPKQRPRTTTPKKMSAAAAAPPSASAPSPASPQPRAAVQPRQPLPPPPPPAPRAAAPPQGAAALPPFAPAAFAPLVRPGGAVFSFGNVGLAPSMPAFPYNPVPHNASDAAGYDAYYAAAHSSGFPFFVNNNNDNESPQDAEAKMQDYMARILVATQLQVPNVPLPQVGTPLPDPLDLTKPESPSAAAVRSPTPTPTPSTSAAASALPLEDEPTPVPVPAAPSATKHRRKGKAYKLERIAMKLQYHADDDSAEDEPERKLFKAELPLDPEPEKEPQPSSDRPDSSEAEADDGEDSSEAQRDFFCEHCEITFRDVIMYSLHKGYHGLKNPFTCNACGKETADRVEFFVHIARSPHS
ncbi:protein hunchback [Schistocerca nitens]|uniref:protein hunchback n=1 Tax=Schistocerca nitens TaxID=7011 RepID=UPI002119621C|nr:protein hunchback [Schistocerca nitens]